MTMLKKILSAALVFFSIATPVLSQAGDLSAMFDGLTGASTMTATDAAGVYHSAARNVVSGGGVEMRVPPRTMINLVSFNPPSLEAGCSGISAHFGGFSFISGQQISQFIQHILQAAPGLVLQLAIKSLCPQCEAVLQVMQSLAQRAAKWSQDSCSVGKQLQQMAASKLGIKASSDSTTGVCAKTTSDGNGESDFLGALENACNTAAEAVDTVFKNLTSLAETQGSTTPSADAQQMLANADMRVNETWAALSMHYDQTNPEDYKTMTILMNLIGTRIKTMDGSAAVHNLADSTGGTSSGNGAQTTTTTTTTTRDGNGNSSSSSSTTVDQGGNGVYTNNGGVPTAKNKDPDFVAPRHINVRFVYDLLMCGTPDAGFDPNDKSTYNVQQTRAVREYCGSYYNYDWGNQTIYVCADQNDKQCIPMNETKVVDARVIQGAGFLYQVNDLLRYGVQIVRSSPATLNWGSDPKLQRLAALIQAAPYPLYQAINAAAVYPAAADDLVDSMAIMTAELMVYHTIESLTTPRTTNNTKVSASQAVMDRMYEAMGTIRAANIEQHKLLGQELALQEGISRRIFQINQTIQKQVMSNDFLGNTRFNSAVVGSLQGKTNQ